MKVDPKVCDRKKVEKSCTIQGKTSILSDILNYVSFADLGSNITPYGLAGPWPGFDL